MSSEYYRKKLDYKNVLEESKVELKELFIEYYGEKYRNVIEEKFKNINKIIGFYSLGSMRRDLPPEYVLFQNFDFESENHEKLRVFGEIARRYNTDRKLKDAIYDQAYSKFIGRYLEYIPEDEKKKLGAKNLTFESDIPKTYFFTGHWNMKRDEDYSMIYGMNCIYCLTKDLEKLSDEEKKRVIETFNELGIDYGTNYEKYLDSEECIRYITLAKEIFSYKAECKKEAFKQYVNESETTKEFVELFNDDSFASKITPEEMLEACNESSGFMFCSSSKDRDIKCIVVINLKDNIVVQLDRTVIHEINHCLEVNEKEKKNNGLEITIGWLERYLPYENNENQFGFMRHCCINEVINETIEKEIYALMKKEGKEIFGENPLKREKYLSYYEVGMEFTDEFFKNYKDSIIESRLLGNMQSLYDEVGQENFDALSSLLDDFYNEFEGSDLVMLFSDIENEKKTELTKRYNEMLEKRDKILKSMEKYSLRESEIKTQIDDELFQ